MQTDILASVPLSASGQFTNQAAANIGRCRVKAVLIIPSGTAGTLVLKDGGSGGTTVATFNTPASATQPMHILLPGEGLLFSTAVYGTLTSVGFATVFYG